MDEETKRLLNEFLQKMLHGGDFLAEQAPLLAQDVITYGRLTSTVGFVVSVVALVVSPWFVFKKQIPWVKRGSYTDARELSFIGTVLVFAFAVSGFFICGNGMLLSWLAPRLYLIEYLKAL